MHMDDDKYERIIRDWVYHRCCKRHKHVCGPPPKYVQEWCDWFVCICEGHSGEEEVPAPPPAVGVRTSTLLKLHQCLVPRK